MSTKCKLCNGDLTAPGREGGVYLTGIGPIGGDCTRRIVTAAAYEYPVAAARGSRDRNPAEVN